MTERSDFARWYGVTRAACEERFGGDFRKLCWGSMIYACGGKLATQRGDTATDPCGWEHRVLMGVGVEGPPAMKAANFTIPSPFYCGRCPKCGGSLAHDRWNEDEEWEPREIPDEPVQAFFYVPTERQARRNARRGYGGAEYNDPTGQTTTTGPRG